MRTPSRRVVLGSAAAAALTGISWKIYSVQTETYLAEDLTGIFETYRHHAVSVGESYLRCTPHEADRDTLLSLLAEEGGQYPDEPEAIRRYVRDRIRHDFARGLITEVDGWILSRTEARLCAITALTVQHHAA